MRHAAAEDRPDAIGNRLTQTAHPTAGGGDQVTSTYTYPAAGGPQPHTLTGRSVTDPGGTVVDTYSYDEVGNTISRPGETGEQTLTWDPEGHLESVSDGTDTTSYVYDVSGNRLITHHDDGSATLYLPEGLEVRADGGGVLTCSRYYGGIAVRTSDDGLSWLATDHHGTASHVIAAGTLTVTTRCF